MPFKSDGRVQSQALYASDQWTINHLTLNGGVRYDHFNVGTLPIDLPAGPFIGARHYDARTDIPNYNDITPRVGAAYDSSATARPRSRRRGAGICVGLGGGALTSCRPSNAIVATTARPWNDSPGVATPGTGVSAMATSCPTAS